MAFNILIVGGRVFAGPMLIGMKHGGAAWKIVTIFFVSLRVLTGETAFRCKMNLSPACLSFNFDG